MKNEGFQIYDLGDFSNKNDYIANMKVDKTWGGLDEIRAAELVYNVRFRVWTNTTYFKKGDNSKNAWQTTTTGGGHDNWIFSFTDEEPPLGTQINHYPYDEVIELWNPNRNHWELVILDDFAPPPEKN